MRLQLGHQRLTRFIGSYDRREFYLCTQGEKIENYVARTAKPPVPLADVNYGHRGLRGHPLYITNVVGIDHDIADNEHLELVARF
jgi:hypothetical protein